MTLDQSIRAADPALEVEVPSGSSSMARWQYMRIVRSDVEPRPQRLLSPRRVTIVAALALVVALVALLVVPILSSSPASGVPLLRTMAEIAGDQPALVPGAKQYLYT